MRWTAVFGYLSAVVVATLLLSHWWGWTGWLLVLSMVLALPFVVVLARSWWHPLRWSSVLAVMSAVALLGSLVSEFAFGSTDATGCYSSGRCCCSPLRSRSSAIR